MCNIILEDLAKRVFPLGERTKIRKDTSYITSYPHLIGYFADKKKITEADVACGAHMAYGWMPTILKLRPDNSFDLKSAAATLTKARRLRELSRAEISALSRLINNSLVGASKLLHFVAPNSFAIWDSKVYSFVYKQRPHNFRVNNVDRYIEYLTILKSLAKCTGFKNFHSSVKRKVGYDISPMRSLELVMFLNAPEFRG